jgi:excisionase family DNA binding protein
VTLDETLRAAVAAEVAPLVHQVAELTAQVAALRAPAPAEPELLTVKQYAARAGLSPCTIRRRISDGGLPHVRVGAAIRIPAASLRPTDPGTVARLARVARS